LLGGQVIDRFQKSAGNIADRQHLDGRPLRRSSNGSTINAATFAIVLFIFIYFVHLSHLFLRERRGEVSEKFEKLQEKLHSRGIPSDRLPLSARVKRMLTGCDVVALNYVKSLLLS
jgi:hypothetical protein